MSNLDNLPPVDPKTGEIIINPLKEDGTPKTPKEIEKERKKAEKLLKFAAKQAKKAAAAANNNNNNNGSKKAKKAKKEAEKECSNTLECKDDLICSAGKCRNKHPKEGEYCDDFVYCDDDHKCSENMCAKKDDTCENDGDCKWNKKSISHFITTHFILLTTLFTLSNHLMLCSF